MKRLHLLISISLLCSIRASGQTTDEFTNMVDVLPPAPNAAAITRYGGIGLNKNTGTPNIEIPLFTIKGRRLSTNIALKYSSGGLKVDEIASRVGMGWILQSGGVITRTVRGITDELNTRIRPWANVGVNWSTWNFARMVVGSTASSGGYDSEPDLFSFNFDGYGGTFIIDSANNVYDLTHSALKFTFNLSATDWNFKIVTPNGVAYYFGGSTATEKTKRDQTCGKSFSAYVPTAWYLKEIVHPNGEKITFGYTGFTYKYDNGLTQSMYAPASDAPGCSPCNILPTSTCVNESNTNGVRLTNISSALESVVISYINRTDCEDKLVSRIEYKDASSNILKFFNLSYTVVTATTPSGSSGGSYAGISYTPYLTSVAEFSPDSAFVKPYLFTYNDAAGRPPRLSYSQDHWGYFNNKPNQYFVPPPTNTQLINSFTYATAARDPDTKYAIKGMLSKITYPTGGIDSILYESNDYYGTNSTSTKHQLNCSVTGTGFSTQVTKTSNFSINTGQDVKLVINCIDNTSGSFDPLHHKGTVEILTAAGSSVFYEVFSPGGTGTRYVTLSAGSYKLKLYANGTAVTTDVTQHFYPVINTSNSNYIVGGVRVKTVLTGNVREKPMVKNYYYGALNNVSQSSLVSAAMPVYYYTFNPGYCSNACLVNVGTSSSLNNIFDNFTSYAYVVEGNGENFEGGAIESKFNAGADSKGTVLWGAEIPSAPLNNTSTFLNGKPLYEIIYKKNSSSLIPVKKTEYSYKIDNRWLKSIYGYKVTQNYNATGNFFYDTTCNLANQSCQNDMNMSVQCYNITRYEIASSWVYLDTARETVYDEKGLNPLTTISINYYNNLQNLQVTRKERYDSKGVLIADSFYYPHAFAGQTVYDSMINRNIISPLINTRTYYNGTQIAETKTKYANWGNGNFAPDSIFRSTRSNPLQVEGVINYYDPAGNILQYSGKDGITNAIIWGYGNSYPVAKVVNATYSQAIAQLSVDTASLQSLTGNNLLTELNRIRTGLSNAHVTSYNYKRSVGVTSITDINNHKASFEYDAFNRLKHVRDQDSNLIKKNEYSYAEQDLNGPLKLYFNADTSATVSCNTCQTGYTPYSTYYYNVPAGKYYSVISQADANSKAAAEIITYGVAYANKIIYCATAVTCSGASNKWIGCICETGTKIYTAAVYNSGTGLWTCTYHYRWSDNSTSGNYQETSSTSCLPEEI